MVEYSTALNQVMSQLFPPESVRHSLGELVSERGLKLFAKEVLPVVKSWKSAKAEKAAA